MKRTIFSAIVAIVAAVLFVITAQAQADKCISGYVWREAFPGDHVCVTPATRAQAAYDNRHATERYDPDSLAGALYGGETCLPGYVWREASPSDLVCVTPATRDQTAYDNSQAQNRLAYPDSRRWDYPRWGGVDGNRLDWCLNSGSGCGQPAADRFCHRKEYRGARSFAQDPDIGASEPTTISGSDEVCNQSICDGFKYITCYGRIPEDMTYENPSLNGYRLDECYYWDTGCGKMAANAYCREEGYSKSLYYRLDAEPGYADTLTIGTNEVCNVNEYNCRGFQLIICQ